jgi:tripartite-type tricarboxylate transporter receptor subunit TctC
LPWTTSAKRSIGASSNGCQRVTGHRMRQSSQLVVSAAACWLLASIVSIGAQPFPSQPIRIVAGAAGNPGDIVSRIVANELGRAEGWRVIVENKPGGMQTIAAAEVLKQSADGYTILQIALPTAVAPALLTNLNFRLDTDFAPLIKLATADHILVVHPSVSAASLPQLVALLKNQPDKLTFSSGGFGSPAHLAGELLKLQTGVRATHVPYSALPRAIADLLNGTNQFQFINPLPVLDLISAGKLRALTVTGTTRMPVLKDVPTVVEEGFPGLVIRDWFGLLVKSGTPHDAVLRLNEAINKVLKKPEMREAIAKLGAEPAGGSAREFGEFLGAQLAYWGKVINETGMTMHR